MLALACEEPCYETNPPLREFAYFECKTMLTKKCPRRRDVARAREVRESNDGLALPY